MSFESTSTSIKNLSGRDKITLDLLFEMMVCVAQDIQKYNNVTDLSVTPVGDQSVLLKNACNVMQLALSAYTKNKEGMSEYSSSIQERFAIVADDMKKALSEAEELKKRIEDGEAKERELETKRDELELSRGHLLKVGEECDDLQRQIDILSDSALDKKAEEKKKLDAELSQRTIKADNLDKDIGKLRTGNEALKNSIFSMEAEKTELNNEVTSLTLEKTGLEKGIENLGQKLKEYKEWIDNFPAMSEQVQTELNEKEAIITTMINAMNSALSEDFLKENLFKTQNAAENCSVKDYPDYAVAEAHFENIQELQQWTNDMSKRINGLLNVYETMLRNIVNQSGLLTSKSDS